MSLFCIDMNIEAHFYRYINISDINDSSSILSILFFRYRSDTVYLGSILVQAVFIIDWFLISYNIHNLSM